MLLILRAWLSVESRVDTAVRVLIANFPAVKLLIKTITPPQLSFPLASLPLHLRVFLFAIILFHVFLPFISPPPLLLLYFMSLPPFPLIQAFLLCMSSRLTSFSSL